MRGDRHVPDASPIVGEECQDEQEAVGRGRDDEEIGRDDLADVIPQEGAPGLRRRLAPTNQIFRDSGLTDVDSEFQQFAMNPRRALARICARYFANERADVSGHGRPPHAAPTPPGPPQPETSSVPGDDGLRLDDDERRSPSRQPTREHDAEPTVRPRELQPPRPGALQHVRLVAQGQHLELERGARTRPCAEGLEERDKHRHHRPEAYPSSAATSTATTRTEYATRRIFRYHEANRYAN